MYWESIPVIDIHFLVHPPFLWNTLIFIVPTNVIPPPPCPGESGEKVGILPVATRSPLDVISDSGTIPPPPIHSEEGGQGKELGLQRPGHNTQQEEVHTSRTMPKPA